MTFYLNPLDLELIGWMEGAGIKKIPVMERPDFKSWVNILAGREVFSYEETYLPTKEEQEANHWFSKEGY